MSPITSPTNPSATNGDARLDLQSALPLSERARALLERAFGEGWLGPEKVHHASAKVRNLLEEAKESIADNLKVDKSELEFVGELGFGFWTVIAGALQEFSGTLVHAAIDRQIIHAFAREHQSRGHKVIELPASKSGQIDFSATRELADATIVWQETNRETGVRQEQFEKRSTASLIADMTASMRPQNLPSNWDLALWDPRSFAGPEGLAIIGIRNGARWTSPIPKMDHRRIFGSYSKPLLLLTAIALEDHLQRLEEEEIRLFEINSQLRALIPERIRDISIIGESSNSDPRYLALVVKGVIAEELLRKLEIKQVLVDAGSACGAGALSPSHVLEAMGYGVDGHIRLTLKAKYDLADMDRFVDIFAREVEAARS